MTIDMGMDMGIVVQAGAMREAEGLRGMMVEDMAIAPRGTTTGPELHVEKLAWLGARHATAPVPWVAVADEPNQPISMLPVLFDSSVLAIMVQKPTWSQAYKRDKNIYSCGIRMQLFSDIRVELECNYLECNYFRTLECNYFRTCGGIVGIEHRHSMPNTRVIMPFQVKRCQSNGMSKRRPTITDCIRV